MIFIETQKRKRWGLDVVFKETEIYGILEELVWRIESIVEEDQVAENKCIDGTGAEPEEKWKMRKEKGDD